MLALVFLSVLWTLVLALMFLSVCMDSSACACVSQCLYGLLCLCLCFLVFVWTLVLARVFLSVRMDSCACACVSQCLYGLLCLARVSQCLCGRYGVFVPASLFKIMLCFGLNLEILLIKSSARVTAANPNLKVK